MENFLKCTTYTSPSCGRAHASLGPSGGSLWGMALVPVSRGWEVGRGLGGVALSGPCVQKAQHRQLWLCGLPLPVSPHTGFGRYHVLHPGQPASALSSPLSHHPGRSNISQWCQRASFVKSENLSLDIIPIENLLQSLHISSGEPSIWKMDTSWQWFSCQQRSLPLKQQKQTTLLASLSHTHTELYSQARVPFPQLR